MSSVPLVTTRFDGPEGADAPPCLIVHGLFGSGRNWRAIARLLARTRPVMTVDLRNHGGSPWTDTHTYPEMAADLAAVLDGLGQHADVIGHSMGGKAAMVLAHSHPARLRRLIVADIAPVVYGHDQAGNIAAMRKIDPAALSARSEAQALLAAEGLSPQVQAFFTQSLDLRARRWVLNLDVLDRDMPHILGFPALSGPVNVPTLFLSGGLSDYVRPTHRDAIRDLFPAARFASIPGTGHWLHAEKPRAFAETCAVFLDHPGA